MIKKLIGVIVVIVCGIALAGLGYVAYVVAQAKRDTPALLGRAMNRDSIRITVNDLSGWQKNALLMIEDPGFDRHRGVDLKTPGAGLTTITQSLVKKLYFDNFKPGFGKIKQTLIARYALDGALAKDDQLTLFINIMYLGNAGGKPVYGFDNAARAYYGKTLHELSEDEYLSIVAMIIAPENFSIIARPQANRERTLRLKKVVSGEYKPASLMDIYYGELDRETQKGLASASYFSGIYHKKK